MPAEVFRLEASWTERVPPGLLAKGDAVRFADLGVLPVTRVSLFDAMFPEEVDEWDVTLDDGFRRASGHFQRCTPRWPSRGDEGVVEPEATLTHPFDCPAPRDPADIVRFTACWTERFASPVEFAVGDRLEFEDIGTLTVANVVMPYRGPGTELRPLVQLEDGVKRPYSLADRAADASRRYWATRGCSPR